MRSWIEGLALTPAIEDEDEEVLNGEEEDKEPLPMYTAESGLLDWRSLMTGRGGIYLFLRA